jgi:hypothetical protein
MIYIPLIIKKKKLLKQPYQSIEQLFYLKKRANLRNKFGKLNTFWVFLNFDYPTNMRMSNWAIKILKMVTKG